MNVPFRFSFPTYPLPERVENLTKENLAGLDYMLRLGHPHVFTGGPYRMFFGPDYVPRGTVEGLRRNLVSNLIRRPGKSGKSFYEAFSGPAKNLMERTRQRRARRGIEPTNASTRQLMAEKLAREIVIRALAKRYRQKYGNSLANKMAKLSLKEGNRRSRS